MPLLPLFQSSLQDLMLLQNKWKSVLDSFVSNPSLQTIILPNVLLNSGSNVVNHLLGRNLQGWRIVRQRGAGTIYDNQDNNVQPGLTLILIASQAVTVNIEVF